MEERQNVRAWLALKLYEKHGKVLILQICEAIKPLETKCRSTIIYKLNSMKISRKEDDNNSCEEKGLTFLNETSDSNNMS